LPVGVPVPWPSETPPTGWLKCNGAPFSAEEYPKLAKAYQTNKLPDLRGEFLRGWDDGRGVDSGRALMSAQGDAIRNITGNFGININGLFSVGTGVFDLAGKYLKQQINNITSSDGIYSQIEFDASRQIPTASENRPRNIAFNFIVRAA
ncbi:TPA: tail fiber protein, partial [Escherichia coli]|nr:tail fiber protein [Escherichia coli]